MRHPVAVSRIAAIFGCFQEQFDVTSPQAEESSVPCNGARVYGIVPYLNKA
jgi:hypothetical protein